MLKYTENNVDFFEFEEYEVAGVHEGFKKLRDAVDNSSIILVLESLDRKDYLEDVYKILGSTLYVDVVPLDCMLRKGPHAQLRIGSENPDDRKATMLRLDEITGINLTKEEATLKWQTQ